VLLVEREGNSLALASVLAPQVAQLARDYTHVLAPATTFGKDLLPRAAAMCGVGMLSDVSEVDGPYRLRRPIYAGNAIETVEADPNRLLFATVRPTAFEVPAGQPEAPIVQTGVDVEIPDDTRLIEQRAARQSGPDLQTARTVVAGGRGLGGDAGVELIGRLASALSAAVGASRAAVDSGWMSNDLQVGQTGKVIAPDLYIGAGISGAIQHLTGIRDAGTIVAINKDADAPICSVADFVLVDDLFSALPELIEQLKKQATESNDG
jgi:electron transfer flavoprotein alpha subunit